MTPTHNSAPVGAARLGVRRLAAAFGSAGVSVYPRKLLRGFWSTSTPISFFVFFVLFVVEEFPSVAAEPRYFL
jgi:hypothetical protein